MIEAHGVKYFYLVFKFVLGVADISKPNSPATRNNSFNFSTLSSPDRAAGKKASATKHLFTYKCFPIEPNLLLMTKCDIGIPRIPSIYVDISSLAPWLGGVMFILGLRLEHHSLTLYIVFSPKIVLNNGRRIHTWKWESLGNLKSFTRLNAPI
jgi:hypothetical protein